LYALHFFKVVTGRFHNINDRDDVLMGVEVTEQLQFSQSSLGQYLLLKDSVDFLDGHLSAQFSILASALQKLDRII
jgi:hypothetical protein